MSKNVYHIGSGALTFEIIERNPPRHHQTDDASQSPRPLIGT